MMTMTHQKVKINKVDIFLKKEPNGVEKYNRQNENFTGGAHWSRFELAEEISKL